MLLPGRDADAGGQYLQARVKGQVMPSSATCAKPQAEGWPQHSGSSAPMHRRAAHLGLGGHGAIGGQAGGGRQQLRHRRRARCRHRRAAVQKRIPQLFRPLQRQGCRQGVSTQQELAQAE